jgi:cytochrome d ubiquinol oxidase subunit II
LENILPVVWAGIIAFAVFFYVVLDGFDLGIGILFLSRKARAERDLMMNSVAPVWDGNETWLVIGGAGLMGTFPRAYAALLPALYLPVIVMLIALIFRGVAFEFRFKADRSQPLWDLAFFVGATLAAFFQGVILGTLVQGVPPEQAPPAVWLTPFSLIVGVSLVAGYALLGACWLIMKTTGDLQEHARRAARPLLLLVLAAMGIVSLWMVVFHADVRTRWFSLPNLFFLAPVPILAAAAALVLWRSLSRGPDARPFLMAIALFTLGYLGLGVSRWPYIVPPSLTIWQAASPPKTQLFILAGAVVILPMVLGYFAYLYRLFRGKVSGGYQH